MRRRSTAFRVLSTVVVLLASLLTGAGTASAQPSQPAPASQPSNRGELPPERAEILESKTGGSSVVEECRMRSKRRHRGPDAVPSLHAACLCSCFSRMEPRSHEPAPFTGRRRVPPAHRSVDIPVRHQVFRC